MSDIPTSPFDARAGADALLSAPQSIGPPPWPTDDPFLFCVHHLDAFPAGDAAMGPAGGVAGREIGMDFANKDGWNMYHGDRVPGFPQHPHRGFETVTFVRRGFVDHSDSLGATARYGAGDVQWLTAGGGIVHAEMFPLLRTDAPNPMELFQIWLNLPAVDKMVDPHFAMLWSEQVPRPIVHDAAGRATELTIAAGRFAGQRPPAPPPRSYASLPDADVAIWTVRCTPGAQVTLPAARRGTLRSLYAFRGEGGLVAGQPIRGRVRLRLRGDAEIGIEAGPNGLDLLLLQAKPIGEPVAKHGPFVMNTREELMKAYSDYRATQFGGWPWSSDGPVHPRDAGRFAVHVGGRVERPPVAAPNVPNRRG